MATQPGNSINLNSTIGGLVNFDGTATFNTTALTQYNTLAAASATTVENITPGTTGYVLTSAGASAYPSYQALPFTKMPWTDKASLFTAVSNNGYFCTATFAITLPSAAAQGDVVAIVVDGSFVVTITGNTGQTIQLGKAKSASAGTCASNFTGDTIFLTYRTSDTNWIATSVIGTWTIT